MDKVIVALYLFLELFVAAHAWEQSGENLCDWLRKIVRRDCGKFRGQISAHQFAESRDRIMKMRTFYMSIRGPVGQPPRIKTIKERVQARICEKKKRRLHRYRVPPIWVLHGAYPRAKRRFSQAENRALCGSITKDHECRGQRAAPRYFTVTLVSRLFARQDTCEDSYKL